MSKTLTTLAAAGAAAVLLGLTGGLPDQLTPDALMPDTDPEQTTDAPVAVGEMHPGRARVLLNRLHVAPDGSRDGYERDEYGYGWLDLDSDGCNTREEVLARDMRREVRPDGCNVEHGILADPYTGQELTFDEDTDASAVQIDHVIPLARSWETGASAWSDDQREQFANDPLNLIAADGPTNASKGDQGAGEWQPPNRGAWCMYAVRYVRVADRYQLQVTSGDVSALRAMLGTCD